MPSQRRMIHADIHTDEWFGSLSMMQRMLWIGLLTACADDQGRLPAISAVIRSRVFPYDDISLADIAAALDRFVADGRLHAYEVDGRALIQIVHWWRYQTPSWAEPSAYPAPENWQDRARYHKRGAGAGVATLNWDQSGGFVVPTPLPRPQGSPLPTPLPTPQPTPLSSATNKIREDKIRQDKTSGVKQQQKELTRAPSDPPLPDPAAAADSPPPGKLAAGQRRGEGGVGKYPETPLQASQDPDIAVFKQVSGFFPGQSQYRTIIDTLRLVRLAHPGADLVAFLAPFLAAWTARTNTRGQPYDPLNLGWLTEWALNGRIPDPPKPKQAQKAGGARARLAAELNTGGTHGD